MNSPDENVRTELNRKERLLLALSAWAMEPPATNGLLCYKQLTECIDKVEDQIFGKNHWDCPRTFLKGDRTNRIYTILSECFHSAPYYPVVSLLLAKHELVFISRFGAAELQTKLDGAVYGPKRDFDQRTDKVIFSKKDSFGHGVWHEKNRK